MNMFAAKRAFFDYMRDQTRGGQPLSESEIQEAWQIVLRSPCTICRSGLGVNTESHLGLFRPGPEESLRIGGVPGMQREVWYRLCPACWELPEEERIRLAETSIFNALGVS